MSTASAAKPAAGPQPDENTVWQEYNRNFEFPVSTMTAVFLHIVAGIVLFLVLSAQDEDNDKLDAPAIRGIKVVDLPVPTGSTGRKGAGGPIEAGPQGVQSAPTESPKLSELPPMPTVKDPSATISKYSPSLAPKDLRKFKSNRAFRDFQGIGREAGEQQARGLAQGGAAGGGEGDGPAGRGDPDSKGTVGGEPEKRAKRQLRWTINFQYSSGEDYLRQLAALGAFVAVPDAQGQLVVFEDLRRPNGVRKDIGSYNRMYFNSQEFKATVALARALGLRYRPPYLTAMFPRSFEAKLARLEKKASGGLAENQIRETVFAIRMSAGRPEVKVLSVTPLR